ncbi:unnamed protein product [Candida verbasci]|uniref:DASH complex subunit DAD1 n=1 Tax=Candida verbasci TaxID=1227364 RepID=A0A9W4TRW8_9ASCO|nr:unnamed protein product [Candida verbasci]
MSSENDREYKNELFTKQRDLLIQDISNNLDQVYTNLEILNRSLNESIQIGKEFDDVGRLWATFYDGMKKNKVGGTQDKNNNEREVSNNGNDNNNGI